MIIGTGIDAVSLDRCRKLSDSFIKKVYCPEELEQYKNLAGAAEDIRVQFLASRFAVKEAFLKALGVGLCSRISLNEICTCNDESGKPYIKLSSNAQKSAGNCRCNVSITHEYPLAIAIVVLED